MAGFFLFKILAEECFRGAFGAELVVCRAHIRRGGHRFIVPATPKTSQKWLVFLCPKVEDYIFQMVFLWSILEDLVFQDFYLSI